MTFLSPIIVPIIPTFNKRPNLAKILSQLNNQEKYNYKLEIVVVVDGSTDGTREMLRDKFNKTHIIIGTGDWWYTKCINEGIKYSKRLNPDYILTLNDDLEIPKDYIKSLIKDSISTNCNSIIGSASITKTDPSLITFSGVYKVSKLFLKEYNYIKKFSSIHISQMKGLYKSKVLSGRGILIPYNLINKIGLFDELFVQYGSDTDFSWRAYKAGCEQYISYNSIVFENIEMTSEGAAYNRPTLKSFIKSYFNPHSINSISKSYKYFKKHSYSFITPFYLFYILFGSVYLFLFKYKR